MTTTEHPIYRAMRKAGMLTETDSRPRITLPPDIQASPPGDALAGRYARKALAEEVERLANCPEGARNDQLNKSAFALGQLVAAGHLDGEGTMSALRDAAHACGLDDVEFDQTAYRAAEAGAMQPREVHLRASEATPYALSTSPPAIDLEAETALADNQSPDPEELLDPERDVETRYPPLDWHQLFADKPEDVEWAAYPLLEYGRLYSLYSPAKAGKSLFMLDLCAALAAGKEVLGQPRHKPVDVLYVDFENAPVDLLDRLVDMDYKPEELKHLHYLSFPSMPVLDSATGGQHLLAAAVHYGAKVVVIDTVSRVISGEENSADTFNRLYQSLMPLKSLGCCVVRLDHTGKDESSGMRGSSAKVSDVDVAWKLTKTADEKIRLDKTASRNTNSPEHVTFERQEFPLRHLPQVEYGEDSVNDVITTLDKLGVPPSYGRDKVKKVLREAGYEGKRNTTLSEAIRLRKSRIEQS